MKELTTEERTTIETSFYSGFAIRLPNGTIRRFPACQWHDDRAYRLQGNQLIKLDSRDNGFAEIGRETLPDGTQWTSGFHDDELGEWFELLHTDCSDLL